MLGREFLNLWVCSFSDFCVEKPPLHPVWKRRAILFVTDNSSLKSLSGSRHFRSARSQTEDLRHAKQTITQQPTPLTWLFTNFKWMNCVTNESLSSCFWWMEHSGKCPGPSVRYSGVAKDMEETGEDRKERHPFPLSYVRGWLIPPQRRWCSTLTTILKTTPRPQFWGRQVSISVRSPASLSTCGLVISLCLDFTLPWFHFVFRRVHGDLDVNGMEGH